MISMFRGVTLAAALAVVPAGAWAQPGPAAPAAAPTLADLLEAEDAARAGDAAPGAGGARAKQPVPPAAERTAALGRIREIFGDDLQEAKAADATIVFSNHSMYDQAWIRSRWVRKASDPSPFIVGADGVTRYMTVLSECAKAAKIRTKS